MRRRGVGVDAVHLKRRQEAAFAKVGAALEEDQMGHITNLLGELKSSLENFARKHRKAINSDPAFRMQFQAMCENIGVDPLASNKGFWAEILGVGDFYYELSVQVTEICLASRATNGGLMALSELLDRLREKRASSHHQQISEDDVRRAVGKLQALGRSFSLLNVKGRTIVQSVPRELSSDHEQLLGLAESRGGMIVGVIEASESLNWAEDRTRKALVEMMQEGMVWFDSQAPSRGGAYYFPALFWAGAMSSNAQLG